MEASRREFFAALGAAVGLALLPATPELPKEEWNIRVIFTLEAIEQMAQWDDVGRAELTKYLESIAKGRKIFIWNGMKFFQSYNSNGQIMAQVESILYYDHPDNPIRWSGFPGNKVIYFPSKEPI